MQGLVLAVCRAWLGERAAARWACATAAEALAASPDSGHTPLIRKAALVLGLDSPEVIGLLSAAAGEPQPVLTAMTRHRPDQAKGYRDRADWFGRHGLWREAASDLTEAVRLDPNVGSSMYLGILLAHLGETDRYREHCRTMLAHWADTTVDVDADRVAKTCLLLADSRVDPDRLAKLVAVAVSGGANQRYSEWFLLCKGLHDYRSGRYADAIAACRESRRRATPGPDETRHCTATSLAVESMAQKRLGDDAGAWQSLSEARRLIEDGFSILDRDGWWQDWLTAQVLCREAEALIEGPKIGE